MTDRSLTNPSVVPRRPPAEASGRVGAGERGGQPPAPPARQHPRPAAHAPPHPPGQPGGEGVLPQVQVSGRGHVNTLNNYLMYCNNNPQTSILWVD